MKRFAAFVFAALAAAAATADAPSTRVDFTSQPERATVVVDGQDRGVTPVTLFGLAPGRHHVKLRMPGYVERDRYITVDEGRPAQHSSVLEPEKAILLVKSEPSGCEISIDGVSFGMTPRLVTTLNSKDTYTMTLRKPGYRTAKFDLKFSGRTPLVRSETLIRDSGVVMVLSDPAGAEVTVNGIVRGKTPVTVHDVPKGRAAVKLTMPGFKDEVIPDLMIAAGDHQTVSRILRGLPGTLSLVSLPEGARFYINDEFRGKSPVVVAGLAPGGYVVRAELEGYGTETRRIDVGNGSTPREEFRLSNKMGRLEVRTSPVGAQVVFDGHVVGTTSSPDRDAEFSDVLAVENVMEGEHTLVVRKDGYSEVVKHPRVKSSSTVQTSVRMRRIFVPDVEIVTDVGTYRGILVNNSPDYVTVEVTLGIQRSFPRADIRKINFLNAGGGK